MQESFYNQQLSKKLEGEHSADYKRFLNSKGKPLGSLGLSVKTKSVKSKPLFNVFSPKMREKVQKACKNCEEMFEWDHKHSRKEFDARRFCNNHCRLLYHARPKENA